MSDFDKLKYAVSAARNAQAIRDRDFFADECVKLRASLAAAEAKLAAAEKHADELARACKMVADKLHSFGLTETASVLLSVQTAHATRRAHDAECESEFDSQVHAQTPCGCAARRAARDGQEGTR